MDLVLSIEFRPLSGVPRLVPGGEVHVLPLRVPAGEQDEHVDHLQEVRAERAALREALVVPVLLHHRRLCQRQVQPLPRQLPPLRAAQDLRAVQAEMRFRQAGTEREISRASLLMRGPRAVATAPVAPEFGYFEYFNVQRANH